MREEIMESPEEDFVRSLSHCVNWQARGGKSGAVFYATEGCIRYLTDEYDYYYCCQQLSDSETAVTASLVSVILYIVYLSYMEYVREISF